MRRTSLAPALTASALVAALLSTPLTAHAAGLGGVGDQDGTSTTPSLTDSADGITDSADGSTGTSGSSATPEASASPGSSATPASSTTELDADLAHDEATLHAGTASTVTVAAPDAADATITVLGVTWDAGQEPSAVEYRTLDPDTGSWGGWTELGVEDGGPDAGTADAAQARSGTEPLVVLDGAEVEVRAAADPLSAGAAAGDALTVTTASTEVAASDANPATTTVTATTASGTASASSTDTDQGLTYTSRKGWGANEKLNPCKPDLTSENKAMTVHHTAGATSYSKAQVPGILRGIHTYHTQSLGWCDVGYNMLVDRYGRIFEGRAGGLNTAVVGAHASGFNTGSFGVSVLGTYSSPAPAAAVNALGRIGAWQANKWGYEPKSSVTFTSGGGTSKYKEGTKVTLPRIFGHRQTSYTECPGNGLYGQLGSIRNKASDGYTDPQLPPTKGAIGAFYQKNRSKTGVPLAAEKSTTGGFYQRFEHGNVYWSSKSGAHFILGGGGIRSRWAADRYEKGRFGYPTSEEYALTYASSKASAQNFTGGMITTSKHGNYALVGGISTKWKSLKWERGFLGLPRSDEKCTLVRGGCYQSFEGGSIHWSSKTGAHPTKGAIRTAWKKQKYENGRLGYPTSGEFSSGGKIRQNFEGGYVTWSPGNTQVYYR